MNNPAGETVLNCHECGASVYKEHLDQGMAGFRAGRLLCAFCMKHKDRKYDATPPPPPLPAEPGAAAAAPPAEGDSHMPPISLADVLDGPEPAPQKPARSTATVTPIIGTSTDEYHLTRPLNKTGTGATRCKIFHSKLSDEATRHMDQQINEWCDRHPEIEIKSCTSTVGIWTGKHAEPNLIVTVFY